MTRADAAPQPLVDDGGTGLVDADSSGSANRSDSAADESIDAPRLSPETSPLSVSEPPAGPDYPDEHIDSDLAGDIGGGTAEAPVRRSWPQRITALVCVTVIACALFSYYWIDAAHSGIQQITRINFALQQRSGSFAQAGVAQTAVRNASTQVEEPANPTSWAEPQDSEPLLQTETPADAPVNFLIVGTDSALGVAADDPVLRGRYVDPNGRSRADVIMLVRLDPASGSGWVLSIPRDLWVDIPRGQENRINSALWIGGAPLLVETITQNFQIEVNHYVKVDFAGFQSLVDALGGVPVWFSHPAMDKKSKLDISTTGCHVLDGRQALQYVRSRSYTELIGGEWRVTGGNDLHRIERQQDFVVLALNRAVKRGIRNPNIMAHLLESVVSMVTLDQDLAMEELLDLGMSFKDFDPSDLHRQRLDVYPLRWSDGSYKGEAAYVRENQAILNVFRGQADTFQAGLERIELVGADAADLKRAGRHLKDQGFVIAASNEIDHEIPFTVVMHDREHAAEAVTVARYLNPLPYVVLQNSVEGVLVALGDDHKGVRTMDHPSLPDAEAQIASRGHPDVLPDLSYRQSPHSTVQGVAHRLGNGYRLESGYKLGNHASVRYSSHADKAVLSVLSAAPARVSRSAASVSTVSQASSAADATVIGRPPEGESCE